jgi:hypothetical protein
VVVVVDFVLPLPLPPSELPVFVVGFVLPLPLPPSLLPVFATVVGGDFAAVVEDDIESESALTELVAKPATTNENISPSDKTAIALVAFSFFIFAPIN